MSATSIDVSRYTYRVTWSVEDHQFVATCPKFPSHSWLTDTHAVLRLASHSGACGTPALR